MTVQELRDLGFQVWITHHRRYINLEAIFHPKNNSKYLFYTDKEATQAGISTMVPTGGTTTIKIIDRHGNKCVGNATCSDKDQYNKKTGVQLALNKALKRYLDSVTSVSDRIDYTHHLPNIKKKKIDVTTLTKSREYHASEF